jgi:hypothetical protein
MRYPPPWHVVERLINGKWEEDFMALVLISHYSGWGDISAHEFGVEVWGEESIKNKRFVRFNKDDIWRIKEN